MGARKHIIPDLQDFKLDEMNVALMQRYINGIPKGVMPRYHKKNKASDCTVLLIRNR